MKEMIYQAKPTREVLEEGNIGGYHYYVLSLGTHPCAYVQLPEIHPLNGKKAFDSEMNIDCHGGITYADSFILVEENIGTTQSGAWFIGWDYAHFQDFSGYGLIFPMDYRSGGQKWTTEEIVAECKKVIEQLKGMK